MGLSIVQRIIAGFVLMLLLLVLLGFISILKIRGINEGLSQVSDRATPLVIAVAGLKGALQDSNRWVLTYRTSEEAAQLPQLASQFKAQQERFLAQSKGWPGLTGWRRQASGFARSTGRPASSTVWRIRC
jgi:methyl-accepting chemotaxis protein